MFVLWHLSPLFYTQRSSPVVWCQQWLGWKAAELAAQEPSALQPALWKTQTCLQGNRSEQPGGAFFPRHRIPKASKNAQGRCHCIRESVTQTNSRARFGCRKEVIIPLGCTAWGKRATRKSELHLLKVSKFSSLPSEKIWYQPITNSTSGSGNP